jgi:hypothetical protein
MIIHFSLIKYGDVVKGRNIEKMVVPRMSRNGRSRPELQDPIVEVVYEK